MYTCPYPHLFAPIKIGGLTMKNRIFAAPASQPDMNPGTWFKKENVAYYEMRARGGAAVVNLGDVVVHTRTGRAQPHKPLMDDPTLVPSLSDVARAIRQHGAFPCIELSHCGKYANVDNLVAKQVAAYPAYGPNHEFNEDGVEIHEMPEEIILEVVKAFGDAAVTAKRCGFQMVMVHGGHGWLLHQFMAPTNHRTDKFGGSFENRMRLTLMVLDSVRAAVGPGFPIEFRMSGYEGVEGGYEVDYGVKIAQAVESRVDLIHVSAGIHDVPDAFVVTHPDMFKPHGVNVRLAAEIKKHVSVPVATIGGLSDPAQMEEIIASGKADIVEVSRALMADPFLPKKAQSGHGDDIVKCMRCFACMTNIPTTRNMRCALNPVIGRELEYQSPMPKAGVRKYVLVAGGGPGGMQAALTAARRGHRGVLCEAAGELGGEINCEKYVPFKQEYYAYGQHMARAVKEAGVEIRLNTPVTQELVRREEPDALILAIGATPKVPDMQGIDSKKVVFAQELKKEKPNIGRHVVIVGAGLVGCETAVHLKEKGHEVVLVGRSGDYAKDAPMFHKTALKVKMQALGLEIHLNTTAVKIGSEGVVCREKDGQELTFQADTVFCAMGMQARTEEVNALRALAPEVYTIGDCVQPGQVFWAVSGGYYAALDL